MEEKDEEQDEEKKVKGKDERERLVNESYN